VVATILHFTGTLYLIPTTSGALALRKRTHVEMASEKMGFFFA
jgi:hypothetical protein